MGLTGVRRNISARKLEPSLGKSLLDGQDQPKSGGSLPGTDFASPAGKKADGLEARTVAQDAILDRIVQASQDSPTGRGGVMFRH